MKVTLSSLENLVSLSGDASEVSKHLQHNVRKTSPDPVVTKLVRGE